MKRIAAIVLAAGGARRMGRPKALLPFRGEPLLCHAVRAARGSRAERVVVVLGEQADALAPRVQAPGVECVENPDWREGLSSSIRCGLAHVGEADGVLLVLGDQPLVRADVLDALVDAARDAGCDLAACAYGDTLGPPALFGRVHLPALQRLRGDRGARPVLEAASRVARVPFDDGAFDIDTPEDFERLLGMDADPASRGGGRGGGPS